ncbi:MAG TPA: hypothetical protein VIJ01_10970 [Candidatus Angelobacter sp.]|jgi:hypothetical protein
MPLRLLVGSLVLGSIALIRGFMPTPAAQADEKLSVPKWEYKALRLEASQCVYENQIATALNTAGQDGWELVGYERLAGIPNDASGTLLIRPAATGQGREHTPQTVDSFQGTISMKMPQTPGACRFLFKRQAPTSRGAQ